MTKKVKNTQMLRFLKAVKSVLDEKEKGYGNAYEREVKIKAARFDEFYEAVMGRKNVSRRSRRNG